MQFLMHMELLKLSSEYCKGTVRLIILMSLNLICVVLNSFDVVSKHLQRMCELPSAFVNEAKCKQ